MKLLFDHNLSHKLVARLSDVFPGSTHTRFLGFERAADLELWFHARTHDFVVVTKDEDYSELLLLRGAPPKVIWFEVATAARRRSRRRYANMPTKSQLLSRIRSWHSRVVRRIVGT